MINGETFYVIESRLDFCLKRQQCDIIIQLCDAVKNIFTFWPTGFGKSALYMIPLLLMDEVEWSWSIILMH